MRRREREKRERIATLSELEYKKCNHVCGVRIRRKRRIERK